jgi:hypothetical protein
LHRYVDVTKLAGHPRSSTDHPPSFDDATPEAGTDDRRDRRVQRRLLLEVLVMGPKRGRVAVIVVDDGNAESILEGAAKSKPCHAGSEKFVEPLEQMTPSALAGPGVPRPTARTDPGSCRCASSTALQGLHEGTDRRRPALLEPGSGSLRGSLTRKRPERVEHRGAVARAAVVEADNGPWLVRSRFPRGRTLSATHAQVDQTATEKGPRAHVQGECWIVLRFANERVFPARRRIRRRGVRASRAVALQPVMDLQDRTVFGYEALPRGAHAHMTPVTSSAARCRLSSTRAPRCSSCRSPTELLQDEDLRPVQHGRRRRGRTWRGRLAHLRVDRARSCLSSSSAGGPACATGGSRSRSPTSRPGVLGRGPSAS